MLVLISDGGDGSEGEGTAGGGKGRELTKSVGVDGKRCVRKQGGKTDV